jgi:hypothetical protein
MPFRIEISDQITPHLEAMEQSIGTIMQDLVEQMSEGLTPFVQQNAPVGEKFLFDGTRIPGGQLRDSLHFVIGQWGSTLAGAKQGEYVIGGTKPHEIRPKAKPRLAFFWPKVGQGVVFGKVNHPGTKANDFRESAIQQAFDELVPQDIASRIMAEWVTQGGE